MNTFSIVKLNRGYGIIPSENVTEKMAVTDTITTEVYENAMRYPKAYKIENGKFIQLMTLDEIETAKKQTEYPSLVEQKIRQKYSVRDELAILRQRDSKPEEFDEYNAYCEQCKAEAKATLNFSETLNTQQEQVKEEEEIEEGV